MLNKKASKKKQIWEDNNNNKNKKKPWVKGFFLLQGQLNNFIVHS